MHSTRRSLLTVLAAAAALFVAPALVSAQSEGQILRAAPDEIDLAYDELEGYQEGTSDYRNVSYERSSSSDFQPVSNTMSDGDIVRAAPDEIDLAYDELTGYDGSFQPVAIQTLYGLDEVPDPNLDPPTLRGLVSSAESVSVIRISESSTSLGRECDVFYGAEFEVEQVLAGNEPPMNQWRLGRVDELSDDECDFVRTSNDVAPYFERGERYIYFESSDWGDVVLPYSMLNDVRSLTGR